MEEPKEGTAEAVANGGTEEHKEEKPQEEESFDMGNGGQMTQAEIDKRFHRKIDSLPPFLRDKTREMSPGRRRSLVNQMLKDPDEDDVRREMRRIEERAAVRVDDKCMLGDLLHGLKKIEGVMAGMRDGAKVLAFQVTARIIDPADMHTVSVGATGGTVADTAPLVIKAVKSVIDQLNSELDQDHEASVRTFVSMLEANRANDKIEKILKERAALRIMAEEQASKRDPGDNPALSKALAEVMGDRFAAEMTKEHLKRALMGGKPGPDDFSGSGTPLEALKRLREIINPDGELCGTCDKDDCDSRGPEPTNSGSVQ